MTAGAHQTVLDALAARFLKPERPRLRELRDLARAAGDLAALAAAVPDPYGPDDVDADRRWFASDRARQRHRQPPDPRAAALFWSDPIALRRAEDAARELARRLWVATHRPGPVPYDVVWRISGSGSVPDTTRPGEPPRRALPILTELAELVGVAPVDPDYKPPFAELAGIVAHGWRHGGPDPVSPLIDAFATGLGVWAVAQDHIALFVPDRADAPTRWSEAALRPNWQSHADAELVLACRLGWVEGAVAAISRGARPAEARIGRAPLLDWVCERLSEPWWTRRSSNAETWAALCRLLLQHGAEPGRAEPNTSNPLASAIGRGGGEALVAAGFPVDAADADGRTALHQLCAANPALVPALLALGASVDARDTLGQTPLHVALLFGHAALMAPLLAAGADPHAITADGRTAYHAAAVGLSGRLRDDVVAELVERGVVNRPDHAGRVPVGPGFPDPPTVPTASARVAQRVPQGLIDGLVDDEGWAVLADWFQDRDDVRGELVARALRRDPGLTAAVARHRAALLRPFVDAHPLGALLDGAADARWTVDRGVVRALTLSGRFADGLPELLDHPGADLLDRVALTVPRPTAVGRAIPRLPVRHLEIGVEDRGRGTRPLKIPVERLPQLRTLHVRCPDGVVVDVDAPELVELRLEQPYQPGRRWQHHRIAVPRLTTLQIVAGRAPTEDDPGFHWLRALFDDPPPALRRLELRPVPVALLEALVRSALLPRLTALTLSSVRPELLEGLGRYSAELAPLQSLEVTVLGTTRAHRQTLEAELQRRLSVPLTVRGIEYRKVGAY